MNKLLYERPYRINTYEADASGRLGIPGLFNYLQDAASHHASLLGRGKEELEKDKRFWVLSRMMLMMNKMPDWEEEIIIRTWPRGIERLFALRDFEILGSKGQKFGVATSCWLMLNNESRKPVRPDTELAKLDGKPLHGSALKIYPSKLAGAGEKSITSPVFLVKYSDLDFNMHVNNVQYIRWVIDSYPPDFLPGKTLASAEINYLSESLHGDEIRIRTSENGEGVFNHTIERTNNTRELCRLKIIWKE
jgi:acyl-ACP thioesterase